MSETANQIMNLIEASGKAAPVMTKALKKIGNGSMQTGITKIAEFFTKEGVKVGTIRGAIGGVVGTAAVGGLALLIAKIVKEHHVHKAEGEVILKALEDSMAEADGTENSIFVSEDAQEGAKPTEEDYSVSEDNTQERNNSV